MRSQLKKIEDLGAAMEEALILDNKYTEHSTVGLAQQWDQLDQLGMRMQHNLEQQIQARYTATRPATDFTCNPDNVPQCGKSVAALSPRSSLFILQEHHWSDRGGPEGVQHDVQVRGFLLTRRYVLSGDDVSSPTHLHLQALRQGEVRPSEPPRVQVVSALTRIRPAHGGGRRT